jgi:hypothetical protein
MRRIITSVLILWILGAGLPITAQISPGPLASVHSQLEGMSNCTKCHTLGNKVTNDKCLACHTELSSRVFQNKGYHASGEVKGKQCVVCHSDHHGLTFQIVRFDKSRFNHDLTGFQLLGAHAGKECKTCHKSEFISSGSIRSKKFTYLGLTTTCVPCHADYHQQTLASTCTDCHTYDAFKPAPKFDHSKALFHLTGSHQTVPCIKCHPVTTKNNAQFQQFKGILFKSCTNCHTDPHKNQFGPDCRQCHNDLSFHTIKGISNFDHSKTAFRLEDKHRVVPCASCHKTNLTDPLKHDRCTDCHADYHNSQFMQQGVVEDCADCHSTKGYNLTSYTIERHTLSKFPLQGSHLATPCIACHKKQDTLWNFRNIGLKCIDCHPNVHENFLSPKYYQEAGCQSCHNPDTWSGITFDHSVTGFILSGPHATLTCRDCHFRTDSTGHAVQRFANLSGTCTDCHADIHFRQFEQGGSTNCLRCHRPDRWKIDKFDHNTTAFKLDGKHINVPCDKCHKRITAGQNTFVLYKIKDFRCESCH